MIAVTERSWATLTKGDKRATVLIRRSVYSGGAWTMSESARRRACTKLGASHEDPNPGVVSSHTIRAVDATGWHTFTFWAAARKE